MKKTLLILCALLLTAISASAQITDVTDEYIQNPSFETVTITDLTVDEKRASEVEGVQTGAWTIAELTDWTLTGASNFDVVDLMTEDAKETDNNLGVPGEAADGTYMLYLKKTWGNSTPTVLQTITLPAGTYMLTVDSKCFSGGSSANLVAGSASNAITINGTAAGSETSHPMTALTEWTTNELTFIVTTEEGQETAEVEIGVKFTLTNTSPGSFVLDNFKLYSVVTNYSVTKVLDNPSFEDDDPIEEEWEADTNSGGDARCNSDSKGAWIIPSSSDGSLELTGWSLKRIGTEEVFDIMTKEAAGTDNNLGTPGDASDGDYMLYIKKSWGEETDQVSYVEQTITLPAGDYVVTVDSKFFSNAATAKLVAGEASADITINGTTAPSSTDDNVMANTAWTTNTLTFTLNETTELTIGVEMTFANASLGSLLLDNFQLFSAQDVVVWEMTDANWGTMIIPFDAAVPEGLTLYAGDGLTVDGSTLTVGEASASSIAANTPYLVKGTEGTYTFTGTPINEEDSYTSGMLTGTLVDMVQDDFPTSGGTVYVLQNHEDDGEGLAFYPITSSSTGVTLDAYHCYLTVSAEETEDGELAKLSIVLPGAGEETGIVAVEGAEAEANGAIYDLSGRRVAKAVKGVYIQNGKKVLVK